MTKEEAKEVLRKHGYFVDNLWNVVDLTDRFECSDEVAQEILYKALTHPFIMESIHDMIYEIAMEDGINEKGGDQ
jgi:hypothetical protein